MESGYSKRRVKIPIEDLVKEWKDGSSTRELGKKYNTSSSSIADRLREYARKTGQKLERDTKIIIPMEDVIEELKKGKFYREIAKKYGVSEDLLYQRRKLYEQEVGKTIEEILSSDGNFEVNKKRRYVPVEDMVKDWESGMKLLELAEKYNVSRETVINRLKEYQYKTGKQIIKTKRRKDIPLNHIITDWKAGMTLEKLEQKYNIGRDTISERMREFEVESGQKLERDFFERTPKIDLPVEEIVVEWKNGAILEELAQKYGVTRNTIRRRLEDYEESTGEKLVREHSRDRRKIKKELPIDEMFEDWKNGTTYEELVKKYGVSRSTVILRIREYKMNSGYNTSKKIVRKNNPSKVRQNKPKSDTVKNKQTTKIGMAGIWKEHTNGMSVASLAIKYRMTEQEMKTKLEQYQALLFTKLYVDLNKPIEKIAEEHNLPIEDVQEKIKMVLRKEAKNVPVDWYLRKRIKGGTAEEILKEYILITRQAEKRKSQTSKNDDGAR